MKIAAVVAIVCGVLAGRGAFARVIPGYELEPPSEASPQLFQAQEADAPVWWRVRPADAQEWSVLRDSLALATLAELPALRDELNVRSESGEMGGVPVFILEPEKLPPRNRHRVLLHLHGGGYVLNPGEAGTREAVYLAGIGGFKVVSVDYRMPPEFPFPAALEDALAVYRALLRMYQPDQIGVFGTSTGGGMTLALMLLLKQEGLPLPAAIAPGSPWTDLTDTGDTYATNAHVDNVLGAYDGWLKSAAAVYAGNGDLRDPLVSPVYGEVSGLPPTLLISGTRDLFLSNTARMHRKLREAGVPADLLVIEGLAHAQYMLLPPDTPETLYCFREVAAFFDRRLK